RAPSDSQAGARGRARRATAALSARLSNRRSFVPPGLLRSPPSPLRAPLSRAGQVCAALASNQALGLITTFRIMTTSRVCYLYSKRARPIFASASLIEGSLPEANLGGARQVAAPARFRDGRHRAEAQETRSSGQCARGGEQGRRSPPEEIPDNGKHGHEPQNRHGGASRGERSLFS